MTLRERPRPGGLRWRNTTRRYSIAHGPPRARTVRDDRADTRRRDGPARRHRWGNGAGGGCAGGGGGGAGAGGAGRLWGGRGGRSGFISGGGGGPPPSPAGPK